MISDPDPDHSTAIQTLSVSSHEVSIGEQQSKDIDPAVSELSGDSTSETRDVLDRAAHIARSLAHQQLGMAHILLAMTQSEYALSRLHRQGLNELSIRSACWREVAAMPAVAHPNVTYLLMISEDVRELFQAAAAQAAVQQDRTVRRIVRPCVRTLASRCSNSNVRRVACLRSGCAWVLRRRSHC